MEVQRIFRTKRQKMRPGVIKECFTYREDPRCQGNIYRRQDDSDSSRLLVIDIHGGCWIHGDKDVYDCWNSQLVSQGKTVSTLTYRTADRVSLKEQVQDVFAYLHYLYDHRSSLNISFAQAMLTGDSAGAQLSLLCVAINQSSRLQEIFEVCPVPIEFDALVLTHSVCFIDQAADIFGAPWIGELLAVPGLLKLLYGKEFEKSDVYRSSVRPDNYLDPGMKMPRILLVTSRGDRHFSRHTFALAHCLEQKGIDYSLYVEDDKKAPHVFNIVRPFSKAAQACNQVISDFFEQSLNSQYA